MKKELEEPGLEEKEMKGEKVDRRRKRKKEEDDGLEIKLGLDVDVEGPKVTRLPPKRGGCTSSGSYGISGPKLKVGLDVDVEPGGRKKKKEDKVIVKRPVREGGRIGPDDVEVVGAGAKSEKALPIDQVVGRRASRNRRAGESVNQGMTK